MVTDDDGDNDKTYEPDSSSNGSSEGEEESISTVPERTRKRKRNEKIWKRKKASTYRNTGLQYKDRNGKEHKAKQVTEYNHRCRYSCNDKFDEEKRLQIFKEYWALGDWNLQTSFIFNAVIPTEVVRKKINVNKNKSVSVQYNLLGVRVCKKFFVKTLDISNRRLDYVIKKKVQGSGAGVSPKDSRGKSQPGNKMPDAKVEEVMNHIRSFPVYASHYSRKKNPNERYLDSSLNLRLMYEKYKEHCIQNDVSIVKESFYRYIFNTKFNYSFKKPSTDTCCKCDLLKTQIENAKTPEEKAVLLSKKELHLRKAQSAVTAKEEAVKQAKNDKTKVVIVFDLQKTLPTPVLSCSKVYYSRQLWTYNLCIHNASTGEATMFMWDESQYSRGCLAIASCILKFIRTLPSTVTQIIAFSDNCGGQNKSSLIVKFWSWVSQCTNIRSVDHKFFVPGHSYNECDRDFGIIEKAKRLNSKEIFIPLHWSQIIAKASKHFVVVKMNDNDFITLDPIMPFFVKDVTGISSFTWLHFRRERPFTLFHCCSLVSETVSFTEMNIAAKNLKKEKSANLNEVALPGLGFNKQKNKIKYAKYVDLQNLLHFIPPVYHDFYHKLPHYKKNQRETDIATRKKNIARNAATSQEAQDALDADDDCQPDKILESEDETFTFNTFLI